MENNKLLNVPQVSERLNLSPFTIRAWVYQGKLPHVRLGRRVCFREEDLQKFIKENSVASRKQNE